MTTYMRPSSLAEALTARAKHPEFTVFAGGTDLMVGAIERPMPAGMLDIFGLDCMVGVSREKDTIRIGAATTYAQLICDPLVNAHLPALLEAAREVGAVQIQARGTIGGNVATSSPVGDLLPVLLALDARVVLASSAGNRVIVYRDFCTGYRQTAMRADELIIAFEIALPSISAVQYWRKVGTRAAQAISKVMVAAHGEVTDGKVTVARIGVGAVADRPIRLSPVEDLLVGANVHPSLIVRARELSTDSIQPISDIRSTSNYRRMVAANFVAQFVEQLVG